MLGNAVSIYLLSVLYLALEVMDSQIFRKKYPTPGYCASQFYNNNALLEGRVQKTRMQAERKH